jgi:uncharacterized protein YejL (UPF0352 family)
VCVGMVHLTVLKVTSPPLCRTAAFVCVQIDQSAVITQLVKISRLIAVAAAHGRQPHLSLALVGRFANCIALAVARTQVVALLTRQVGSLRYT